MTSIGPFVLLVVVLMTTLTFGMDEEPPGTSNPAKEIYTEHGWIPEHELLPVAWSQSLDGVQASPGSVSPSHPQAAALPAGQARQSVLGRVGPSTSSSLYPMLNSQAEHPAPYYHIPAFEQHPGGRMWGPYTVGEERFSPKTYPLDIPAFEHLYNSRDIQFQDFEHLYQQGHFRTSGTSFRPDPLALEAIRQKIWTSLREKQKLEPGIVRADTGLREGEYLWPPVHPTGVDRKLDMPSGKLLSKLRAAITNRLRTHNHQFQILYHIQVPVKDETRHFLMFSPKTWNVVNHWAEEGGPRPWAFFESYKHTASGSGDRLALAGLTFLPHHSDIYLREAGIITPAFI
ncbi:uncharacterized protein UTRI_10399 [Ustilago trichophora]|uniref:Effector family protein Eff1 n=1 Tax=Ustilago trichophora TaxID=86804 RepID=A0A5C3E9K7_9BASI|nr:uncharacterized protein UTRI_10399 [Ustilago trichophora]